MRKITGLVVAGALLVAGGLVRAASIPAVQAASDPLRVTSLGGGNFQLRQGRVGAVVGLSRSINGCSDTLYDSVTGEKYGSGLSARVIDEVKGAGVWYLLLQVSSGPNCNVQGLCGAGDNTDLIWLKLSPQLRVLARQSEKVENCEDGLTLGDDHGTDEGTGDIPKLGLSGGVLRLVSQSQDDDTKIQTRITLRYDRRAPGRGLTRTVTRSPLN